MHEGDRSREEKSICVCRCMSLAITILKQLLTVTTNNRNVLLFPLYIQLSLSKYVRALLSWIDNVMLRSTC